MELQNRTIPIHVSTASLFYSAKEELILHLVMPIKTDIQTNELEETDVLTSSEEPCNLIVWNDEVNTFQWVIETLMDVCGHSYEQAEQCSYIIHFQGKYAVKKGSYDELKPMCDAITDRGIGATVEMVVE